jgi:hypothetical protein
MSITPAQMSTLLQLHHFTLRYLSAPNRTGWVVELPPRDDPEGRKQGGLLNRRQVFPTPEDAVEAADLTIQQAAARRAADESDRLQALVESGEVFVRPRLIPDPEGEGQRRVFDVYMGDGTPAETRGKGTYRQALAEHLRSKDGKDGKDKDKGEGKGVGGNDGNSNDGNGKLKEGDVG